MRAIGLASPGAPLSILEVPVPSAGVGEALVAIRAIGVGSHDRWFLPPAPAYPYPIGIEAAGVIEEVGPALDVNGADSLVVGDRVMFASSMQPKGGVWAERAVVAGAALILMPDALGFAEAAALPVAGGVAIQACAALGSAETVFIAGASGAIGTLAVQLAVARGHRVAASASARNRDHLLSMGVLCAVDYEDPEWAGRVRAWAGGGVDAAIAIPLGAAAASLESVRDGGRVVTVSGDEGAGAMGAGRGITVEQFTHTDTAADMARLAGDVVDGRIRVVIEREYPFERGLEALEKVETGHARGKVVLAM